MGPSLAGFAGWRFLFSAALIAAAGCGLGGLVAEIYRNRARRPRASLFYLIILAFTAGAIGAGRAGGNRFLRQLIFPDSLVEDAIQEFQMKLADNPKFKKAVSGMTPFQIDNFTSDLSRKGMKRLPVADLRFWNDLRLKAAKSDAQYCASLWNGQGPVRVGEAFSNLTYKEHAKMLTISGEAALLELNGAPFDAPAPGTFNKGLEEIANNLPDSEVQRFRMVILMGASAPPAEGCFAMKRIMSGVDKLPASEQGPFLRAMADQ